MNESTENQVKTSASLGEANAKAEGRILDKNGVTLSWCSRNQRFEEVVAVRTRPSPRDHCTVEAGSLESFKRLVLLEVVAGQAQVAFMDSTLSFRASLDFYDADTQGNVEGLRVKNISYHPKFSPEFSQWNNRNGERMTQDEFVNFLDENVENITEPNGSELFDICSTLSVSRDSYFSRSKKLQDGIISLEYKENEEATGGANQLSLPKEFTVAVPLFKPSITDPDPELTVFTARLFYRMKEGRLVFWFKINNVNRAVMEVLRGMYEDIEKALPEGVAMVELA